MTNDEIPVYGLDKDLAARAAAKYSPEREAQAREWLEAVSGIPFEGDSFADSLRDGVILCEAMNKIGPCADLKPIKIAKSKMPFKQVPYDAGGRDDFDLAMTAIGVPSYEAFQTVDLYEAKNVNQVVNSIFSLSRHAEKHGFSGPRLGPKLAVGSGPAEDLSGEVEKLNVQEKKSFEFTVSSSDSSDRSMPQHLGDIMSSKETTVILPPGFSPLERILLMANGNIQRILSAYYNSTVTVDIAHNNRVEEESDETTTVFSREVTLSSVHQVCCRAVSKVTIKNPEYLRLIEEQQVGIGQLFRYLNVLPEFDLLRVGRTPELFWREYELKSEGILCSIREEFPDNVFDFVSN
ncbi:Transgelin-3 [Borealophlyctis nickersoniae]|nr:Transgelin-3 [Borealophlyctis nickersoniae]